MMRPPMMMGYGHQIYGNANGTIQQLRNQNQSTIDHLNSMMSALKSIQNESKKNETEMKEMKKKIKYAEHERDNTKIDKEIMDDKVRDVEAWLKQKEHYNDKTQQLEEQIAEKGGENNIRQQANEIEEKKRVLHEQRIEEIRQKQAMETNKLAAELKSVKDEIQILATKNNTVYEYMNTKEFLNPLNYLPNAYVKKMKEQDKHVLLQKWLNIAKENKEMKKKYDNDHDNYTEQMVEQIKNNIKEQNQLRAINQQQSSILQNQESTFQHLNGVFMKSVNDTNDLELDNEMKQYKFNTVNKQPEVYKATNFHVYISE